ncbi:MAG TPA: hypothetical protein ENO24_09120, partial [Chloroflexi bacterium]|nr:hypothetical protein [Chloroflexota bacterium]
MGTLALVRMISPSRFYHDSGRGEGGEVKSQENYGGSCDGRGIAFGHTLRPQWRPTIFTRTRHIPTDSVLIPPQRKEKRMDERRVQELFQSGQIDRRTFLRLMAGIASGTAMAAMGVACAPAAAPTAAPEVTGAAVPTASAVQTTATPKFPSGELTVVTTQAVDTMDVHVTRGGAQSMVGHMLDGLKRRLHTGKWTTHLISSWENVDEVTWLFHLQEGVVFHNGEVFNASVLEYNFKRFADPDTGTMYGGERFTQYHKSCEVVDDYTVTWTTQTPLAPILEFISDAFQMMSPQAITELGADLVNKAVGTGPFKFVEWTPGEKLVMEANEDYWMGPPKLARVVCRQIVEPATRIVELKTGGVDAISHVPVENIPELEEAGGIQIIRVPSEMPSYIELNCGREPFNDVRVRQAMNYAIDRESIVQYVMMGAGEAQAGFLTSAHEGYDPDLKPYPYDPDKARSLLSDAGYPNGFKFTLSGGIGQSYKDKEIMEAVASQLEEIGLTVELNIMEFGAFIGEFIEKPAPFDAASIAYGSRGSSFETMNMSVYSKANGAGWYGYENPEFDALFEEAMATFDPTERDLKVRQLRQILYDDAPFIYIAVPQIIYATRANVHDFYP